MTTWVYQRSEGGLWTVGFYKPDGKWEAESDYNNPDEAATRVRWLNGVIRFNKAVMKDIKDGKPATIRR